MKWNGYNSLTGIRDMCPSLHTFTLNIPRNLCWSMLPIKWIPNCPKTHLCLFGLVCWILIQLNDNIYYNYSLCVAGFVNWVALEAPSYFKRRKMWDRIFISHLQAADKETCNQRGEELAAAIGYLVIKEGKEDEGDVFYNRVGRKIANFIWPNHRGRYRQ